MNKENIEPKNQIESNDYWALSKEKQELYQQVTLQREPWGWVDRFRFGGPGMDELKTVYRLKKHLSSLAQPPAISSNEGETVEQAADIAGKEYYSKEKPANTYTFHEGFKAGSNWQSQHSYTEATCKKCTLQSGNISYSEAEVLAICEKLLSIVAYHTKDDETRSMIEYVPEILEKFRSK